MTPTPNTKQDWIEEKVSTLERYKLIVDTSGRSASIPNAYSFIRWFRQALTQAKEQGRVEALKDVNDYLILKGIATVGELDALLTALSNSDNE